LVSVDFGVFLVIYACAGGLFHKVSRETRVPRKGLTSFTIEKSSDRSFSRYQVSRQALRNWSPYHLKFRKPSKSVRLFIELYYRTFKMETYSKYMHSTLRRVVTTHPVSYTRILLILYSPCICTLSSPIKKWVDFWLIFLLVNHRCKYTVSITYRMSCRYSPLGTIMHK
jgi:hypothetical protein